jgi:hypothetical protein
LKKLLWFMALYGASIATVGAVALALRSVLKP